MLDRLDAPSSRWSWRAAMAALVAFVMLFAAAPRSAAAEPAIEVLEAGWDGAAVYGTWTPVRLRVTGGDQDARALVEVVVEAQYQSGPQGNTVTRFPIGAYGQLVSLPSGATRNVTVWFPAEGEARARARLVVDDETLAEAEVPMQMARQGWPLIGVLADAPRIARTAAEVELPYQGLPLPLAVAELDAESIPTSGDRMRALGALVVQGSVAAELTDAQRASVLEWVEAGGHLLIAGGPGIEQAAAVLPDGVLPASFTVDAPETDLAPLGAWTGAPDLPEAAAASRFQTDGGEVLAGTPDAPLAWRMPVGFGTATVLAVDPSLEPLASWSGTPLLLSAALSPALPENPEMGGRPFPGQFPQGSVRLQNSVGLLPSDAQPGWPLVAAVLGGFALVAGPVLYLVLRRLDRREWSWVIVPVAAVALSAALYAGSVQAAGRDLVANVVSYIEMGTDGESGTQSVAMAFFGPTHERLSVPLPEGGAVRAVAGQGAFYPYGINPETGDLPTEPPYHVIEGGERRVQFDAGQYGQRVVMFDRVIDDAPRIYAEIGLEDGLLVGTVRNDTPFELENAAVVVGSSVVKLGTLAPGQSAPVRLEPVAAVDPFRGYQPISWVIFGERLEDPTGGRGMPAGMPDQYVLPNDPEVQRRGQILDQMLVDYSNVFGPEGASIPLTFFAYTRGATLDAELLPDGHPAHQLTLLRQRIRLTLPPGPFTMPSGLIPSTIVETASPFGFGGGSNGQITWIELRSGSLTYEFRPPLPDDARVESLVLMTQQVGSAAAAPSAPGRPVAPPPPQPGTAGAGPAEEGVFSVFNWDRGVWEPLPAGEKHRVPGAGRVGPDGEVRLRVEAGDSEVIRFVTPQLTLEGEVAEVTP